MHLGNIAKVSKIVAIDLLISFVNSGTKTLITRTPINSITHTITLSCRAQEFLGHMSKC